MQFKYKLKSKWYSADIPKDDYEDFLNMTFADKMKYIKKLEPKEKEDDSKTDLGYSILGTRKEKLKNETVEQMQDKEEKRLLAKKKMEDLKETENEITKITNDLESKPNDNSDDSKEKFNKLEELLEKKDSLVQQIKTLNVENIKLMNVDQVDKLNIKGINKMVSDMNKNNVAEKIEQVKKEVNKVYEQTLDQNMINKMENMMNKYKVILDDAILTSFTKKQLKLYSIIKLLSEKLSNPDNICNKKGAPSVLFKDVLCVFNDFGNSQTQPALVLNSLLNYNPESKKLVSIMKIVKWRAESKSDKENYTANVLGDVFKTTETAFILPIDDEKPKLKEELIGLASVFYRNRGKEGKKKLNEFYKIIESFRNIEKFKGTAYEAYEDNSNLDPVYIWEKYENIINDVEKEIKFILNNIDYDNDDDDDDKALFSESEEGEGIISDIKNAPKKIKQLESKIDNLEQLIKDLIKKESTTIPEPVKEIPKPVETKTNEFTIPKLNHVETNANKTNDDTDFKELKDILERRRQDIEYSEDEDESTDWEDNYTELTAGSLQDATDLIESLRDNYNIVLRMYINKKNLSKK